MDIVLHLGAHKTASTYLQRRLRRDSGLLRRRGISFHGPKSLRPLLSEAVGETVGVSEQTILARRRGCLARLIAQEERAGTRRLVLSDEAFLGGLRGLLSGEDLYQTALQSLEPLADALGGRPIEVALSVRNYATFLASAYGQVLAGWRFIPFDNRLRRDLLNHRRGWPELVGDILQALPMADTVTIWRYEDFPKVQETVLDRLVGSIAQRIRPLDEVMLPGPSQRAVGWLHDRAATGPSPDRATILAAFEVASKAAGNPAFDPWTEDERAYLQARYRQDLIWLSRLDECDWIKAPAPVPAVV